MTTRRWLHSVGLLWFAFISFTTAAQTEPPRPKVALVLSGGGARGIAHVGVSRVLKDLHAPVDMDDPSRTDRAAGNKFPRRTASARG